MLPIHSASLSVYNYDEIPAGYYYKKMRTGGSVQRFWHTQKFLSVAKFISPGQKVLDFGCGPGSFPWVLNQAHPGIDVTGLDVAGPQIQFAKENIEDSNSNNIKFVQLKNEEENIPFEPKTFDRVTMVEVIEHIHPFYAMNALGEIRRVLKDDGRFIVTTPNYRSLWPMIELGLETLSEVKYHEQHISKFTPNSFVKFVEAAGFEVLSIKSIFVGAPFAAGLSNKLASFFFKIEQKIPGLIGSLLIVEARKLKKSI